MVALIIAAVLAFLSMCAGVSDNEASFAGDTEDADAAVTIFDGNTPLLDEKDAVMSEQLCAQIVAICNDIGWAQIEDSIDKNEPENNHYSQDLYVVDRGDIRNPRLWALIEPYVPALSEFVLQRKNRARASFRADMQVPEKPPSADWIFIRKYSPHIGSTRNSLRVHYDTNEHSINLPLNSDTEFGGGGFFVIKPPPQPASYTYDTPPEIPQAWQGLPWLQKVRRENSSIVYFPPMKAGSAVLHNNTVWHGIAPLTAGVKYSLLFFFDMPPQSQVDSDDDDGVDESFPVRFLNKYGDGVALYWIPDIPPFWALVADNWPMSGSVVQYVYAGHIFEARDKATGLALEGFTMERSKQLYILQGTEARVREEL